jgi:hypothetical protein
VKSTRYWILAYTNFALYGILLWTFITLWKPYIETSSHSSYEEGTIMTLAVIVSILIFRKLPSYLQEVTFLKQVNKTIDGKFRMDELLEHLALLLYANFLSVVVYLIAITVTVPGWIRFLSNDNRFRKQIG